MSHKIQVRRGLQSDLPLLDEGEIGFSLDEKRTYIGSPSGNVELAKASELAAIAIDVRGKYGAKGDGITDDTQAIKNAIADMTNNSILYFRSGSYKYTDDLVIDGLLNISVKGDGAGTTRLINSSVEKSFKIKNSHYVDIESLGFIGNGMPPSGVGATGGDGLEFTNCSHLMLSGVDVSFNGGNGINLLSDCWIFNFTNVRIIGNQKNGFVGLTGNSLQATALYFTNCLVWYNKLAGVHWCGVSLTITGSTIEKNQIGVWLDCTNSISPATSVYITGNDFEINEFEQIKLTPFGEQSGLNIKIDGNNFVNTQENEGKATALISIDGTGNNAIGFELGVNNYAGVDYFDAFNGNEKLYADCKVNINILTGASKFKGLGQAKVYGLSNSRSVNGLLEQSGIPFSSPDISDELLGGLNSNGYWRLPVNDWGFVKSVSLAVQTNATTPFTVLFILSTQKSDGTYSSFASGEVTKTGSGLVTLQLGLGLPPISNSIMLCQTYITEPSTGTSFKVKNLSVDGSF